MDAPVAAPIDARKSLKERLRRARLLRAEARVMVRAGLILLAFGFPTTIAFTVLALAPEGVSPLAPLLSGGPLVALGWAACRYAAWRMSQADALESSG